MGQHLSILFLDWMKVLLLTCLLLGTTLAFPSRGGGRGGGRGGPRMGGQSQGKRPDQMEAPSQEMSTEMEDRPEMPQELKDYICGSEALKGFLKSVLEMFPESAEVDEAAEPQKPDEAAEPQKPDEAAKPQPGPRNLKERRFSVRRVIEGLFELREKVCGQPDPTAELVERLVRMLQGQGGQGKPSQGGQGSMESQEGKGPSGKGPSGKGPSGSMEDSKEDKPEPPKGPAGLVERLMRMLKGGQGGQEKPEGQSSMESQGKGPSGSMESDEEGVTDEIKAAFKALFCDNTELQNFIQGLGEKLKALAADKPAREMGERRDRFREVVGGLFHMQVMMCGMPEKGDAPPKEPVKRFMGRKGGYNKEESSEESDEDEFQPPVLTEEDKAKLKAVLCSDEVSQAMGRVKGIMKAVFGGPEEKPADAPPALPAKRGNGPSGHRGPPKPFRIVMKLREGLCGKPDVPVAPAAPAEPAAPAKPEKRRLAALLSLLDKLH